MAAVASSPNTAGSYVRDPVPPEGADSADVARLRQLCELACNRYTSQKGKDTLELTDLELQCFLLFSEELAV